MQKSFNVVGCISYKSQNADLQFVPLPCPKKDPEGLHGSKLYEAIYSPACVLAAVQIIF